jgi:hypothetical protein
LKIRARHRQAIELLSSGVAIGECADQVGVSSRSIYNWLDDDEFKKLLKARESEIIERLNTRLIMASKKALTVLLDGLESRDERIRIRSASIINSSFLKAIEVHDLYDHIDRINEKIDRLAVRR